MNKDFVQRGLAPVISRRCIELAETERTRDREIFSGGRKDFSLRSK